MSVALTVAAEAEALYERQGRGKPTAGLVFHERAWRAGELRDLRVAL